MKQEVYSLLLSDGVMEITNIRTVLHGNCCMDTIRLVQELSLFLAMLDFHSMSLAQQKLVLLKPHEPVTVNCADSEMDNYSNISLPCII